MRYMATVLDKASPIQQRTDPSEDLRTIISRAFLMAQTAANKGGSVPDGVPSDDEDLLGAWRAIYPEYALGGTVQAMQPA